MAVLDAFNTDFFNTVSLTQAINRLPYKPNRIRQMGLFQQKGIDTTTAVIEERDGVLALLPTRRRGEAGTTGRRLARRARTFLVPHIPFEDEILAESIQNVRAFGSENKLEALNQVVADKLQEIRNLYEVTWEHLMVGAVRGIIYDADGSTVIYNLFTEFGISQTTVDFPLSTASTKVRTLVLQTVRNIEDAIGAAPYDRVVFLCGRNWFDAFIDHADVRAAYERWQNGQFLRDDPRQGFPFAGAFFVEYRGKVGAVSFVPDDEAIAFPVGVPNMFTMYYAPADFIETVNTIGQPLYVKQRRLDFDRGIKIHAQSNPLPLCHRPKALIKITKS